MMAESEQDVMSCQYYTQSTTRNFFSIEITKVKKKKPTHSNSEVSKGSLLSESGDSLQRF